jgi:tetratricopeptide (TPR) repeat protein
MARLDRLIPVKEIAQIGACLGREFSYELVAAVSPMTQAQLDDALEKLTASELVFRRNTPPNAVYIFKHALVQDAAYDSLLKSKRQALHGQIAQAIHERFPSKADTEPELLAHHYTEAGKIGDAIVYWQKAGELAQQRVAHQEAVNSYKQAVQLLAVADKTEEHMKRHIDIAIRWADLVVPSAEVISALETAETYAKQLSDPTRLTKVVSYSGQLLFYMGQLEPAAAQLQRVIETRDVLQDKDRLGSAYRCLGQLYLFGYSRCSEALQCIERAMPIVQATGNRFEESCCHGLLGLEYGSQGRFEQSFKAFDCAIRVARSGDERSIECWNLFWAGEVNLLKGDWKAAVATANKGLELAQRIENVWAVNWLTLVKSYASYVDNPNAAIIEAARLAVGAHSSTIRVSSAWCYVLSGRDNQSERTPR